MNFYFWQENIAGKNGLQKNSDSEANFPHYKKKDD